MGPDENGTRASCHPHRTVSAVCSDALTARGIITGWTSEGSKLQGYYIN